MEIAKEIENYYLTQDFNCGEATLRILNDRYGLGLQEADFHLVSGFGGGCGCGVLCGALAASIAALGSRKVAQRAHITPGFKEDCAALCAQFSQCVGSTDCAQIRPRYFRDGTRCASVLQAALDSFDALR